jgi:hypothetical protein
VSTKSHRFYQPFEDYCLVLFVVDQQHATMHQHSSQAWVACHASWYEHPEQLGLWSQVQAKQLLMGLPMFFFQ